VPIIAVTLCRELSVIKECANILFNVFNDLYRSSSWHGHCILLVMRDLIEIVELFFRRLADWLRKLNSRKA